MTTAQDAYDDQVLAALRECVTFRQAVGNKYLTHLRGPLLTSARRWQDHEQRTHCEHVNVARPSPLWALLEMPGHLMCWECLDEASLALDVLGPTCSGCGAELEHDDDDPHRFVVCIALTPHTTGAAEACPDCRALCDPAPTDGGT